MCGGWRARLFQRASIRSDPLHVVASCGCAWFNPRGERIVGAKLARSFSASGALAKPLQQQGQGPTPLSGRSMPPRYSLRLLAYRCGHTCAVCARMRTSAAAVTSVICHVAGVMQAAPAVRALCGCAYMYQRWYGSGTPVAVRTHVRVVKSAQSPCGALRCTGRTFLVCSTLYLGAMPPQLRPEASEGCLGLYFPHHQHTARTTPRFKITQRAHVRAPWPCFRAQAIATATRPLASGSVSRRPFGPRPRLPDATLPLRVERRAGLRGGGQLVS